MTTTLAILAGGEGSRMGRPKGELEINGKPILLFLLDRLNWPGPTLLVTAPGRERPPGSEAFDREATDPITGQGPLRGLHTALTHSTTPRVVIAPVDMPLISRTQLEWLIQEQSTSADAMALMLRRRMNSETIFEPFPSIWHVDAVPVLEERLAHQEPRERSLRFLTDHPRILLRDCPVDWEESTWINLNHPQDLRSFLKTQSRP